MELTGDVIIHPNGKEYLLVNSLQRGDMYLCLMVTMQKPVEYIVCGIRYIDGEPNLYEYNGSDYSQLLEKLKNTILEDLQIIRKDILINDENEKLSLST